MPDPTDTAPNDDQDRVTDSAALLAELDQQIAMLAEGFCPRCRSRLRPHTPDEAAAAVTWASPPHAYCATCDGDVGMTGAGGWFIGYRKGRNITRMVMRGTRRVAVNAD